MRKTASELKELNKISFSKKENSLFFEINDKVTSDICEAVALMMVSGVDDNDVIWKTNLRDIDTSNLNIDNTLYWLSGGDREWLSLVNFNTPWLECVGLFRDKFGYILQNALKKAKCLGDIRKEYNKKLNISIIYDFAIEKNLIR